MEIEIMWNQLRGPLKVFIRRRIHDEFEAEDLLQDVFLKIYTRLDSLRDEQKLQPWIFQIAMGISYTGAKSRVQRGKQKLKEIMLACCRLELDRYGNILDYQEKNNACACYSCNSN
jgi:DNA-directed RNA polymerase specialized sigma24 family protein